MKTAPTCTKALAAALKRRELMASTGASPESLKVMDARIARLSPPPAEEPEQGSFAAALARFVRAARLTGQAA